MAEKLGKGYRPQRIISHVEETMTTVLDGNAEKEAVFGGAGKNATALSISALLAHELSTKAASSHSFDTSAMTAFEPKTGPYLQFWYAKLCLLLKNHAPNTLLAHEDYNALGEDNPADLLRILVQYPEIVHAAYHNLDSTMVLAYLASVLQQLAVCLHEEEAASGADETPAEAVPLGDADAEEPACADEGASYTPGHFALFEAARIVLENGMKLLGITPLAATEAARADTPVQ